MTNIRLNNNNNYITNNSNNTNNYINNNNRDLNLQELYNSIEKSIRIAINKMHDLDHSDKAWQKLNNISQNLARVAVSLQYLR
jgi:hypothetical protein